MTTPKRIWLAPEKRPWGGYVASDTLRPDKIAKMPVAPQVPYVEAGLYDEAIAALQELRDQEFHWSTMPGKSKALVAVLTRVDVVLDKVEKADA